MALSWSIRSEGAHADRQQQPRYREEAAVSHDPGQGNDVAGPDDLTRIDGIGTKRAERLNVAGIRTYAELASHSAADIASLLPDVAGLSVAKLEAWRDQARELVVEAAELTPARAQAVPESSAAAPGDGQHYESFVVRVLLNEDGSIRRTTAQHIQTGAERHWPGLERQELPDFIEAAATSSSAPSAKEPPAGQPAGDAGQSDVAAMPKTPGLGEVQPTPVPSAPAQALPPEREAEPGQGMHPASSAVLSVERTVLRAAERFTMTMSLDLAETAVNADRLAYSAVIAAKPLAGGPKRIVAQSDGLLAAASPVLSIDAEGLPAGAYRLDGAVSLREPGGNHPVALAAMAEGLMVQVLPG
jgi:predicted flap endonuclease-1-like 5' DNA nuclease